jgi:heterodisulfide reductase subunit C
MSNSNFKSIVEKIQNKIAGEQFEFSKHALDQSIKRQIRVHEISEAIATSQLIEDYPNDKYGPSCLLCGVTQAGRPIHVQCSYPSRSLVKIITVYEPDPTKWANDFTIRRLNHDN